MTRIQVAVLCLSSAASIGALFLAFVAVWRTNESEQLVAEGINKMLAVIQKEHDEMRKVLGVEEIKPQ